MSDLSVPVITIDPVLCLQCGSCVRCCPMHVLRFASGGPIAAKPERCIQCRHCTAACPTRAITFTDTPHDYPPEPESALDRLIQTRRSVRSYRDELPDRQAVERALDLASWAPSGKNIHENAWTVLWGREAVSGAYSLVLDWCRETGIYPELLRNHERGIDLITCGAPCVILGHSDPNTLNPVVDTAIAMATAELKLVQQGLATCWGGYLRHAVNSYPPLRQYCGLAEGREVYGVMMTGLAAEYYRNIPYRPAARADWIE